MSTLHITNTDSTDICVPSRMAVHGAPSSYSSLISFRATRLSVSLLRPLNTVAYVPYTHTHTHSIDNTLFQSIITLSNIATSCQLEVIRVQLYDPYQILLYQP